MNDKKSKSVSVTGILFAENIGKATFIFLLLLATTVVASAQPCNWNVNVLDVCCDSSITDPPYTTAGWYYNATADDWEYYSGASARTVLFHLQVDGGVYWSYCLNFTAPIDIDDKFMASIYSVEPSCKNNSIAYTLNTWPPSCLDCTNVSAAQSAMWYFFYIDENFCIGSEPKYNRTASPGDPGWESSWIPDCTAHSKACEMINASINKSVPYAIDLTPSSGSYLKGTPVELEATVDYCAGEGGEEVTVEFKTDAGTFENGLNVYENNTINGKAKATLVCDLDSANVTARVKDRYWVEIVDAKGCQETQYQETGRFIDITDDAEFSFQEAPEPGEVEGYVYEDPNCNCTYDQGEKGVESVTVELVNVTMGIIVNQTTTNSNGYYKFTDVPAGDYTVKYDENDLPAHLSPKCDDPPPGDYANPTEGSVTVPEGGIGSHNFGVKATPQIDINKLVNGKDSIIAERNDTVTFTLIVTNTGIVNLMNLVVTDELPDGLTWAEDATPVQDSVTTVGTTIIVWESNLIVYEPLEPGESIEITFNATADPDAKGRYENVDNVTAESEWGDVSADHFAHVIVGVPPEKVPVLTPLGVAALIGLLSGIAVLSISKSKGMRRKRG